MIIEHCPFPDDLLYDTENDVWLRANGDETAVIGITSILSWLAGKFTYVKLAEEGKEVAPGNSVATIKSPKMVGAVRTPVTGRIVDTNVDLLTDPTLLNSSPYDEGWVVEVKSPDLQGEISSLCTIQEVQEEIGSRVKELGVHCFAAFPDYQMYEIGVECAAALVKLNDLMAEIEVGEVVLVVSDDPTADVEMVRWSDQTGHELVENRSEDNLKHFIVRKADV